MSLVDHPPLDQRRWVDGTLLDTQTTNTNGVWQGLNRARPFSVTVRGVMGGATVTVYVSNQTARPTDSDNNQAVLQSFTTLGNLYADASFRWIKAQVTSAGGGTSITVDVMAG